MQCPGQPIYSREEARRITSIKATKCRNLIHKNGYSCSDTACLWLLLKPKHGRISRTRNVFGISWILYQGNLSKNTLPPAKAYSHSWNKSLSSLCVHVEIIRLTVYCAFYSAIKTESFSLIRDSKGFLYFDIRTSYLTSNSSFLLISCLRSDLCCILESFW